MTPFRDYDLRQVIAGQWQAVNKKIDTMSNEEIMANDLDILAENIFQEFFIEPVQLFEEDVSKRSIQQGKIQKYIDPFFRDYSDKEYVEVDGIIATFFYPYTGDERLFHCRASVFSLGGYPEISVENSFVSFKIERTFNEMNNSGAKDNLLKSLEHSLKEIKDGLSYANRDVEVFNQSLRSTAIRKLQEKHKNVEAYYSIATMLEVPIEKKEYAQTHISLRRNIVPVAKHYDSSNYYGISDDDYKDILLSIKHTVSTYERTPGSYKSMHEEDLRNTILAALNATYKGDATGETFRHAGKTDICIERKNRAAFVAECKMWTGQKEIQNAVYQLDRYLTWRDCKTALVYFVRRKDFIKVLDNADVALRQIDGMRNVKVVDKNEYDCLFASKVNIGQQIRIRVMLFNLYFEE